MLGNPIHFNPPSTAKSYLEDTLGFYCCYCEQMHSDLEVEHIVSKKQDPTKRGDWFNFVLACGCCNGKSNKSAKEVSLENLHFPHQDNTFLSFCYSEAGIVKVNPQLDDSEKEKAHKLMKLVGLDKYPGNPEYPSIPKNDRRWYLRDTQWGFAKRKLREFENGNLLAEQVSEFAAQRGYFSIWYTLFAAHPEVRQALIAAFRGTAHDCFDPANNFEPIPRRLA